VIETQTTLPLLAILLHSQRPLLNRLAQVWLARGASSFSIWSREGELVDCWTNPVSSSPSAGRSVDLSTGGRVDPLSYLVAPIIARKRSLGELRLEISKNRLDEQPSSSLDQLEAEALLIGQLAKFESELQEITAELVDQQDQLLALYELSRSMRSHLGFQETLQALAEEAGRLVGSQGAVTLLYNQGWPSQLVTMQRDEQLLVAGYPPALLADHNIVALFWKLQEGGREFILNPTTPEQSMDEWLTKEIQNLLFVPILVQDKAIASLVLVNKPQGFTSPALKLVRAISYLGGAQLENVMLYQESLAQARVKTELELAAWIQLQLLPRSNPLVPGLEIYGHSNPALQVGGDFYSFMVQPGRPFIFSVGDITGKGLPAALLMAMTRTVFRNAAQFMPRLHNAKFPTRILMRISDDLYNDFTQVGLFTTIFVGQYDPAAGELHYANAGHSPVIYCPASGKAELLESDSPPVGVLPQILAKDFKLKFGPGDLLVVATDGFSEASNQVGELFGYERLLEFVTTRAASDSAETLGKELFRAIHHFSAGHNQDDDQTLVVIKGV